MSDIYNTCPHIEISALSARALSVRVSAKYPSEKPNAQSTLFRIQRLTVECLHNPRLLIEKEEERLMFERNDRLHDPRGKSPYTGPSAGTEVARLRKWPFGAFWIQSTRARNTQRPSYAHRLESGLIVREGCRAQMSACMCATCV